MPVWRGRSVQFFYDLSIPLTTMATVFLTGCVHEDTNMTIAAMLPLFLDDFALKSIFSYSQNS